MRTLKTQSTRAKRSNKVIRSRRAAHVPLSRARVLRTCCSSDGGGGGKKLTEKLRALKSILPPSPSENVDGGGGETEQLFQETADYIVRLRTQVVLLQKLIEIYDNDSSSSSAHKNDVFL